MSAAKNLALAPTRLAPTREPDAQNVVKGDSRAIAVAKFRELADKLERGEIDGASCEWRHNSWLEDEQGKPSKLGFCTLTPQRDENWHGGTVQLTVVTIEEG
jgi:hypothetical protein